MGDDHDRCIPYLHLVGPITGWLRWFQAAHRTPSVADERRRGVFHVSHRSHSVPGCLCHPSLARSLSLSAPVLGFASAMAGPDEDEDEVLAHFLESEILSSVPDQVRSCLPSVSFRLRVGCRARVGVRVCL